VRTIGYCALSSLDQLGRVHWRRGFLDLVLMDCLYIFYVACHLHVGRLEVFGSRVDLSFAGSGPLV
jgi:hypothetical protein